MVGIGSHVMCFVLTSHDQVSLQHYALAMPDKRWHRPRWRAHPAEYWRIRPFLDQAAQFKPGSVLSLCFKILIVFGVSAVAGLATLQTRRSPSAVCVANISDFCFDDDACHAKVTIGEGARDVVKVWRIVKAGCNATISIEPLR